MDKVQKPINSECYTPSSEPIRINICCIHDLYDVSCMFCVEYNALTQFMNVTNLFKAIHYVKAVK
jgi:hypothetical protein